MGPATRFQFWHGCWPGLCAGRAGSVLDPGTWLASLVADAEQIQSCLLRTVRPTAGRVRRLPARWLRRLPARWLRCAEACELGVAYVWLLRGGVCAARSFGRAAVTPWLAVAAMGGVPLRCGLCAVGGAWCSGACRGLRGVCRGLHGIHGWRVRARSPVCSRRVGPGFFRAGFGPAGFEASPWRKFEAPGGVQCDARD